MAEKQLTDLKTDYEKSSDDRRLKPLRSTFRYLYMHSGNLCAMESCSNLLIDENGTWIGEVAHICAAADDGPRADPTLSAEERRHPDNLMLVCSNCHTKIDSKVDLYTVEVLKSIKERHEARYKGGLSQAVLADSADGFTIVLPKSLNRLGFSAEDTDFPEVLKSLSAFAKRLSKVPIQTRYFLVHALRRSEFAGGEIEPKREVLIEELKRSVSINEVYYDDALICKEVEILKKYGFAYFDYEDDQPTGKIILVDEADVLAMNTAFDVASESEDDGLLPKLSLLEEILVRLDFTSFQ